MNGRCYRIGVLDVRVKVEYTGYRGGIHREVIRWFTVVSSQSEDLETKRSLGWFQ